MINPGYLKKSDKKGHPPSFAVLELKAERVSCRIINLLSGVVLDNWQGKP